MKKKEGTSLLVELVAHGLWRYQYNAEQDENVAKEIWIKEGQPFQDMVESILPIIQAQSLLRIQEAREEGRQEVVDWLLGEGQPTSKEVMDSRGLMLTTRGKWDSKLKEWGLDA